LVGKIKKIKIYFAEYRTGALGKEDPLPSARTRLSAKIRVVSFRRRLTAICRVLPFAEYLALSKNVFAECLPVPSVLLSVNMVVTESRTLLNAADKDFFAK
jgi:hypothetical protein